MLRISGCAVLFAVLLTAASPGWQSKPVSGWSVDEARQFLAGSPWVKTVAVTLVKRQSEDRLRDGGRMGSGSTHIGLTGREEAPPSGKMELRWESALPVRVAEMKSGEIAAPDWEGEFYAIAIYDVPGVTPAMMKTLRGDLKHTTVLRRAGMKDLKPVDVRIEMPGSGLARVLYLFPRWAEFTDGGARLEFVSQIGRVYVSQIFETGEMKYLGKLEL